MTADDKTAIEKSDWILTINNIKEVASRIRDVLTGWEYTFVTTLRNGGLVVYPGLTLLQLSWGNVSKPYCNPHYGEITIWDEHSDFPHQLQTERGPEGWPPSHVRFEPPWAGYAPIHYARFFITERPPDGPVFQVCYQRTRKIEQAD